MSIAVLMFVLLMVVSLAVFVAINIGYDSIAQGSVVSSSTGSYAAIVQNGAAPFAYGSGMAAIAALAKYEMDPSLRGSNFISNASMYLQYLIVNGTLPNVPPGSAAADTIASYMSGSTLTAYNSMIISATATGSRQVSIQETKPVVSQQNPYSIDIRYTESLTVNTSTGFYSYTIPVNVSVPINGTPDLFYAQQGVYRPVKFGSAYGLATNIGSSYAQYGNTSGFVYGTVYTINSPTVCGGLPVPVPLDEPPYSRQVIIVTPDAKAITSNGCNVLSQYGGLITQELSTPPPIPYLVFPSATGGTEAYLQTGQRVLLYGPGLSVLNVTGLQGAVSSQKYFTSPYAPDYLQRAAGDMQARSAYGMFTFTGYNRNVAAFGGSTSQVSVASMQMPTRALTVTAWVYSSNVVGNRGIIGQGGSSANNWELKVTNTVNGCYGFYDFVIYGAYDNCFGPAVTGTWQFVAAQYNYTTGTVTAYVNGVHAQCYLNGETPSSSCQDSQHLLNSPSPFYIGFDPADQQQLYFDGSISNVQIYGATLTSSQIYALYQQGIGDIPISNSILSGWWPLDGNTNDYSGNGNNAIATDVNYVQPQGYQLDSASPASASGSYAPIPGIGGCSYNAVCLNASMPNIFLSGSPMQLGTVGPTAAYFDAEGSYISGTGGAPLNNKATWTLSGWVYPLSSGSGIGMIYSEGIPDVTMYIDVTPSGQINLNTWNSAEPGNWYAASSSSGAVTFNSWNFIAITMTGAGVGGSGVVDFYVNGNFIAPPQPGQEESNPGANDFAIGGNIGSLYGATQAPYLFDGSLADIQTYDGALSAQQVSQLYQEGISGGPVSGKGLSGWWPLDGSAQDYSGNGNSGAANSVVYEYVGLNASPLNPDTQYNANLGQSPLASGEWQSMGFGAQSVQPEVWTVNAWQLPSGIPSISYAAVSANPTDFVTSYQSAESGSWSSGIEGGTSQQWAFGTSSYRASYFGIPVSPFPASLGLLNSEVGCGGSAQNTTVYSAVTTLPLSGTYVFQEAADDEMEAFYRPEGSSSAWSSVFSGEAWNGLVSNPSIPNFVTVSFPQGSYQFAVDWSNMCAGGLSAFSMSR